MRVKKKHLIINDDVRMGKTERGAFESMVSLLREGYINLLDDWPVGRGARFHVELHVEYEDEEEEKKT